MPPQKQRLEDLIAGLRETGITVQKHGEALAIDFPFEEILEWSELIRFHKTELLEALNDPGYYETSECICRHFLGPIGDQRCRVCGLELQCPACLRCRACRLKYRFLGGA